MDNRPLMNYKNDIVIALYFIKCRNKFQGLNYYINISNGTKNKRKITVCLTSVYMGRSINKVNFNKILCKNENCLALSEIAVKNKIVLNISDKIERFNFVTVRMTNYNSKLLYIL